MKITAIPAQITTVEDRIAGNLNLTQLILLASPLFLSALIFFLLPPVGSFVLYKGIVCVLSVGLCGVLAIRLGDKLILELIKLRSTYELRPRVYIYRKTPSTLEPADTTTKQPKLKRIKPVMPRPESSGQKLVLSPSHSVRFSLKAGGLVAKVNPL